MDPFPQAKEAKQHIALLLEKSATDDALVGALRYELATARADVERLSAPPIVHRVNARYSVFPGAKPIHRPSEASPRGPEPSPRGHEANPCGPESPATVITSHRPAVQADATTRPGLRASEGEVAGSLPAAAGPPGTAAIDTRGGGKTGASQAGKAVSGAWTGLEGSLPALPAATPQGRTSSIPGKGLTTVPAGAGSGEEAMPSVPRAKPWPMPPDQQAGGSLQPALRTKQGGPVAGDGQPGRTQVAFDPRIASGGRPTSAGPKDTDRPSVPLAAQAAATSTSVLDQTAAQTRQRTAVIGKGPELVRKSSWRRPSISMAAIGKTPP